MESVTKVCHKCREEKPYSEFSKNRARPDGYQHWCKKCRYTHDKMKYQTDEVHRKKLQEHARAWKKRVGYKTKYEGAEAGRIRAQKYRDAHPGWDAAQQQKRKARILGNGGSFTEQEFKDLCDKYDNRCLCCGRRVKLQRDHVIPISRGGTSNIDNIEPLCKTCNIRKKNKIIDYRSPHVWETT